LLSARPAQMRWRCSTVKGADLVLLDLMLSGPAGTDVCRSLRQRSDVPVIMLTAEDTEAGKAAGPGLDADDYVIKPFTWHELAGRIRAVLHRQRETGESPAATLETAPEPFARDLEQARMRRPGPGVFARQDLRAELSDAAGPSGFGR
jgi:DNA-binding response OmpR family regulator